MLVKLMTFKKYDIIQYFIFFKFIFADIIFCFNDICTNIEDS